MNIVAFRIHLVLFTIKIGRLCNSCGKSRISYKLWFGGIMLSTILRKEVVTHDAQ
jgi:hypothetical protein